MLSRADLSAVTFHAFSREAMFDQRWYLRPARLVIYSATNLIGMAAQIAATFCMFKYKNLKSHISHSSLHTADLHEADIRGSVILGMILTTFLTLVLNLEYFLLLFWPGKTFPRTYIMFRKWMMLGITVGLMATAILSTIVIANRSAFITGVDSITSKQLTDLYFRPPLEYRRWPANFVFLVLTWITFFSTLICVILMQLAQSHEEKEGPMTRAAMVSSSNNTSVEITEPSLPASQEKLNGLKEKIGV